MCQAGILVDQLVEGSDGDHWVGLRSMVNKLLVTINNFDSTGISLNYATGATDIALINTKYTTDTQSLTVMYNNNKASTVNRPDPTIGGTYQPDYINVIFLYLKPFLTKFSNRILALQAQQTHRPVKS